MREIAKQSASNLRALFLNTSGQIGLNEAIVEKDFWVCWTLDDLFHQSPWKNAFVFKGGTSLSKSWHLIKRFSEDIDLILDWRLLGYDKEEPWLKRSNSGQDQFNKEINHKTEVFLREQCLPQMRRDFVLSFGDTFALSIDGDDPQTIKFRYPQNFQDSSILLEIRLEIGSLAIWTPSVPQAITPFAADYYGRLFHQTSTNVLTVLPERTFWEKVTILHREANRSADKPFPSRYSRHYYDLFCMANTEVKAKALDSRELLRKVVLFKEKFYRCPWAGYEDALAGRIKLLPQSCHLPAIEADYRHMKNMFFEAAPDFSDILSALKNLEDEIRQRTTKG